MPNILIAESEALTAGYFKAVIEGLGYTVCGIAKTSDEAIELSAEDPPDLILMEVQLPGTGDGVDAANRINETACIPVVYLLASDDQSASERIRSGSPADVLVKPIVVKRLWRALVENCPPTH